MAAPDGTGARRAALRLLGEVLGQQRLMSELAGAPWMAALPPEDRARAGRLASEVLRGLSRADRLLAPHLAKRPPLAALNALRLGAVELAAGGAAHGVVSDLVAIVGQGKRTAGYKGLVNAVLRKVADGAPEAWAALPAPKLPPWLRRPLVDAWGREAVAAMEAVFAAAPPLDLTAKGDPAALAEATGGRLMPTGSVRLAGGAQVSALPGYGDGAFWVQDAAAALPVRLLAPTPGERVLDLCAAPGGKAMQIAAAGAEVTAVDLSGPRLERVAENLARTGLTARLVEADALAFDEGGWDAVLLDAPCSATGTIRRHPDLPHARDGAGIDRLIALQAEMIDHALKLLRPGGRLVFCTCSLLPDEGEVQVEEALARHPGLAVVPPEGLAGVEPGWITGEGGLRLRPDLWAEAGGMDGFYAARLERR